MKKILLSLLFASTAMANPVENALENMRQPAENRKVAPLVDHEMLAKVFSEMRHPTIELKKAPATSEERTHAFARKRPESSGYEGYELSYRQVNEEKPEIKGNVWRIENGEYKKQELPIELLEKEFKDRSKHIISRNRLLPEIEPSKFQRSLGERVFPDFHQHRPDLVHQTFEFLGIFDDIMLVKNARCDIRMPNCKILFVSFGEEKTKYQELIKWLRKGDEVDLIGFRIKDRILARSLNIVLGTL